MKSLLLIFIVGVTLFACNDPADKAAKKAAEEQNSQTTESPTMTNKDTTDRTVNPDTH